MREELAAVAEFAGMAARTIDGYKQLAELLRQLGITLAPIAKGTCDHRHREDRYRPSRKLRHLVHARTATCPAPGCNAQAIHNEIDHTVPWPAGTTDECDLSPLRRQCHRTSSQRLPSLRSAPWWLSPAAIFSS
jgi:hypothetical protein